MPSRLTMPNLQRSSSTCTNEIATVLLLLMANWCLISKWLNECHLIYYVALKRNQDKRKSMLSKAPLVLRGVQITMCLQTWSSLHICPPHRPPISRVKKWCLIHSHTERVQKINHSYCSCHLKVRLHNIRLTSARSAHISSWGPSGSS